VAAGAELTVVNNNHRSADDEQLRGHRVWLYVGVVLTEVVVFLGLWMMGRYFGS
jgi:hypothetical protein